MFVNHLLDDRSVSTIDGDLESKRSLLTKLYHAAYCTHEGYTQETHCPSDPLCCASKRLFEHMSFCTSPHCGVPCCKSCRRVWKHYRKCRHLKACPLCSVLPSAYTSTGLAPRFLKHSTGGGVSTTTTSSSFSLQPKQPYSPTSGESPSLVNTFASSAAIIPGPPKPIRIVGGKENGTSHQIPWDQFQKTKASTPIHKKVIHAPIPRRVESPRTPNSSGGSFSSTSSSKPPLSPRRPAWAIF